MELERRAVLTAERTERFVISAHRRSSAVQSSFVNPCVWKFAGRDTKFRPREDGFLLRRLISHLGERYTDIWVLLSDTDRFVSRAGLLKRYERLLRDWRSALTTSRNDIERIRKVRDEIVAFRRQMRGEGWELRLGSLDVQLKGFRGDDAVAEGFRRMVMLAGEGGEVYYIVGSANHIQLDEELKDQLRESHLSGSLEPHYLWYRRIEGILELAGADSQSADSHERLKEYIDSHKSALVKAMYKLH